MSEIDTFECVFVNVEVSGVGGVKCVMLAPKFKRISYCGELFRSLQDITLRRLND